MGQSHRGENLSIYSNISALSMLVGEADPPTEQVLISHRLWDPLGGFIMWLCIKHAITYVLHTHMYICFGWVGDCIWWLLLFGINPMVAVTRAPGVCPRMLCN